MDHYTEIDSIQCSDRRQWVPEGNGAGKGGMGTRAGTVLLYGLVRESPAEKVMFGAKNRMWGVSWAEGAAVPRPEAGLCWK